MATKDELLRLISSLQPGTSGSCVTLAMPTPSFSLARSMLASANPSSPVPTDPAIRQAIHARGIELISFAQL